MRRIVIIGSGFAGMHIAQELAKDVSTRRGLELTVISNQSHFLFTPLWAAVAGGTSKLTQVAIPVRSLLDDDVRLELDTVRDVDLENRRVIGDRTQIDFDFLVVAVGSATNWGGRPEFQHHALECRTGRDAVDAYDAVDRAFEAALTMPESAERRRALTFVVVGAGPGGVELAARLASRFETQAGKELNGDLVAQSRLILIERENDVLPGHDAELRAHALNHLRTAGVEVRLGEAVVGCTADRVELSTQDALGCGTVFWCGGSAPPSWLSEVGFETDAAGRVLVHRSLQAVGCHGVYVVGDIASAGDGIPQTADVAVQQASVVSRNIIADLSGRSRREWVYEPAGTFISLGRTNAIASYRGVVLTGRPAQALWGAMTTRLLPAGVRGLSLVPDLFAGAFASRSAASSRGLLTE